MPSAPPRHTPRHKRVTPAEDGALLPRRHESRESAYQRGYGRKWQAARLGYLRSHPLCVHCLAQGHYRSATVVDHIVPHRGDQSLFWDFEHNVEALCKKCHDVKTATSDGGFGNAPKKFKG